MSGEAQHPLYDCLDLDDEEIAVLLLWVAGERIRDDEDHPEDAGKIAAIRRVLNAWTLTEAQEAWQKAWPVDEDEHAAFLLREAAKVLVGARTKVQMMKDRAPGR